MAADSTQKPKPPPPPKPNEVSTTVVPLGGATVEMLGTALKEVVVHEAKTIATVSSAPVIFVGLMLLPSNYHKIGNQKSDYEEMWRPGMPVLQSPVINLAQSKGERGRTRSPDGTDNPYKKLKPDPKKPGNVIEKDANGKTRSKPAPSGFADWWKGKHGKNPW